MFACFSTRVVGNVRVLFAGAFCLGPDCWWLLMTMLVTLLGSILFLVFTTTVIARVACFCFAASTLGLLFSCATMDPGICTKSLPPPADAPSHEPLLDEVTYFDKHGREQRAVVGRRWCYSCNNYRQLRATHCRFCDVCISRRDHHCMWLGTCVGARNYKLYWFSLWSAVALTLTVGVGSTISVFHRSCLISKNPAFAGRNAFFLALMETHFVEPVLVLFALLLLLLLAPLTAYHVCLVAQNMTTLEKMCVDAGQTHYYNRGCFWENVKASLFAPVPPSIVSGLTGFYAPTVNLAVVVENA